MEPGVVPVRRSVRQESLSLRQRRVDQVSRSSERARNRERIAEPRRTMSASSQSSLCSESLLAPSSIAKARLEVVKGCNAIHPCAFAINVETKMLYYVIGSIVVVTPIGANSGPQGHLISTSKQLLTCVAVTSCGKFAATGEVGHKPCVRVWAVYEGDKFVGRLLHAIEHHNIAINCLQDGKFELQKFSPDDTTLLSVGCQHDGFIAAWNFRTGANAASAKYITSVNALAVSADSSMCVTTGYKSVKYWPMPTRGRKGFVKSRPATLGDKRSANYIDVAFFGKTARILVVAATGFALEFGEKQEIVRVYGWPTTHGFGATCCAFFGTTMLVGCSDGKVRQYGEKKEKGDEGLELLSELTSLVHIGVDPAQMQSVDDLQRVREGVKFPEVRCIESAPSSDVCVIGFADRSLVEMSQKYGQWKFRRSFLSHVGPINAVETCVWSSSFLPADTIITAGSDGTVRFWSLNNVRPNENVRVFGHLRFIHEERSLQSWSNKLCPSLLKTMYLNDVDESVLTEKRCVESLLPEKEQPHDSELPLIGVTCLRVANKGLWLVAGTQSGLLHHVDLSTSEIRLAEVVAAHETEVTCIECISLADDDGEVLASGGRDRMVHVFRRLTGTALFEHRLSISESPTVIRVIRFGMDVGCLKMFVSAVDKTIVTYRVESPMEDLKVVREQYILSPMNVYAMEVVGDHFWDDDSEAKPNCGLALLTACQDRKLRSFTMNGKVQKQICGASSISPQGKIVKMALDPSMTLAASVCSDRRVYVVEVRTEKCLATLCGFGTTPTDVIFSNDFKFIIVTTANGGIFIWRLSKRLIDLCTEAAERRKSLKSSYLARQAVFMSTPVSTERKMPFLDGGSSFSPIGNTTFTMMAREINASEDSKADAILYKS